MPLHFVLIIMFTVHDIQNAYRPLFYYKSNKSNAKMMFVESEGNQVLVSMFSLQHDNFALHQTISKVTLFNNLVNQLILIINHKSHSQVPQLILPVHNASGIMILCYIRQFSKSRYLITYIKIIGEKKFFTNAPQRHPPSPEPLVLAF